MEFQAFSKIARLTREMIVTEKIDGTNAQIYIEDIPEYSYIVMPEVYADNGFGPDGFVRVMRVGSRNRWLSRKDDNFNFCRWAFDNADLLLQLGPGRHFGEWWGAGIQRQYGQTEKRFSLFNVQRWTPTADPRIPRTKDVLPPCCGLVPVLYQGLFDTAAVDRCIESLRLTGSVAAPGFMKPEGVVVFHTAGNVGFKKTIEKDEVPKALAELQVA